MPRVLITVSEQTPQPYRFDLDRPSVKIGRGSENDIAINCRSVSVQHALMERIPGGYQLRDLGSTNGTKLAGTRLEIIELVDGTSAKLGDVSFDFTLSADEQSSLAAEIPADSSEKTEETPIPEPPQAPRPPRRVSKPTSLTSATDSYGKWMFLAFLLFAALAFFIGLSIRHKKEVQQPLLKSMLQKEAPAAPAAE
jgi:pSer/pThr/pTyr-binding forkhead associated (FHA) protein